MSTKRAVIIKVLRETKAEWLSASQLSRLTGLSSKDASQTIASMVVDGMAEHQANGQGKRVYKLIKQRAPLPRGAIRDYIEANPGLTIMEIAEALQCRVASVKEYVRNAVAEERMIRTPNEQGTLTHRLRKDDDICFGCANPLRVLLEKCLREVREKHGEMV